MLLTNQWSDLSLQQTWDRPFHIKGRRVGEEYEYHLIEAHLYVTFSRLHDGSSGMRAEICLRGLSGPDPRLRLHRQLNLLSDRTLSQFATLIAAKSRYPLPAPGWSFVLEQLVWHTIETHRAGNPFVYLKPAQNLELEKAFAIDRFLPLNQSTLLYGAGMAGKSLLALTLAVVVATGTSIGGFESNLEPSRVLYLDYESTQDAIENRLGRIALAFPLPNVEQHIVYQELSRGLDLEAANIRKQIDAEGIKLLIVDSLVAACGYDSEKAEAAMRLANAIRSLGPITTIILHHLTKADSDAKGLPRPFGSIMHGNLARSTWLVRKALSLQSNLVRVALYHTKVNDDILQDPRGIVFSFRADGSLGILPFDVETHAELSEHMPVAMRIRTILGAGSATIGEMVEELDEPYDTISKSARRTADIIVVGEKRSSKTGRLEQVWGLRSYEEPSGDGNHEIPF